MAERVALVTGGGGGMGRAIALELAGGGRAVAVADLRADAAGEAAAAVVEAGGRALGGEMDVTDSGSGDAAVKRAASELGAIDVALSHAGRGQTRPVLQTREGL